MHIQACLPIARGEQLSRDKVMDITEAIVMLEAVGFHMYRKILHRKQQVGAVLVYTPFDLYCRVILDGGTTFLDFGDGEWHDAEGLKYDLPTLLMQFAEERDAHSPHLASESVAALESEFLNKLAEIETKTARKLDFLWEVSSGCWMGIYRGAVLEINTHLRVIALDGEGLTAKNMFFGYTRTDAQAGMSLQDAFAFIDKQGGYEEIHVEELVRAG